MSRRELKALCESQRSQPKQLSRLRSGSSTTMDTEHENVMLEASVAGESEKERLEALVAEERREKEKLEALVAELRTENAELIADNSQITKLQETIELLKQQLEGNRLSAELERLRVVDKLREDHQKALQREQAQVDFERERVGSLTQSFGEEKAAMQATIARLEAEN